LFVPSIIEGEAIAKVLAPVLQIMPELRGVSASPDLTLAVEHVEHVKDGRVGDLELAWGI
jgi:hypothetical protein